MTTDFTLAAHGSICLLRPVTLEATAWVTENIPDDAQWFGGAVVVEPRFVGPLIDGIVNDGLTAEEA